MQNKRFWVELTYNNVGQGLFYSGRIDNFNFIYDCGSENRRHMLSVIRDFKRQKLKGSKVDLLILSHLHDDHVSGLNALFENGTLIDTVVLPYLSPVERLMVSLESPAPPSWMYSFWTDPVSYLLSRGTTRVVLIGGHEANPPEDIPVRGEPAEDTERKFNFDETLDDDEDLKNEVVRHERRLIRGHLENRKLLAKNHSKNLIAKGFWLFRFFNSSVPSPNLKAFEDCVRSIVPEDEQIISAIENKMQRRRLKNQCYRKLQGDFNNTSLTVYHAPIDPAKIQILRFPCNVGYFPNPAYCFRFPNKFRTCLHNVFGHFLLGDIDLKRKWLEVDTHYRGYLSKVTLALVPHHGSDRNWNKAILDKTMSNCCWVTSAGIFNKHGHPSSTVLQDVVSRGGSLCCCNEGNEVSTRCYCAC